MRKLFVSKVFMMIAGILAAVIVVLSQSFHYQTKEEVQKIKTEQKADQHEVFISASSDAVSPTSAIQLDENTPALLQEVLVEENDNHQRPVIRQEVVARYFKVLFRTLISPNAP